MRYVDNVTFKYCLEQTGKKDEFFFTVRGVKGYIGTEKPENYEVFVWDTKKAKWMPFEIIKDFNPVKKKKSIKNGDIIDNITNMLMEK